MSLIGSFNNYDMQKGKMELFQNEWIYTTEINEGEYLYRFVINNSLEVVDPEGGLFYADSNAKIWSLLLVDTNDQRLHNANPSSLNIENYYIYSKLTDQHLVGNKKQFNLNYDNQVCVMFKFTNVIGIHHVSIVWMSPFKSILKIEEYPIYINNDSEPNETSLLSVLSFDNDWNTFPSKGWLARLFVNGTFILEDEFEIHSSTEYSSLGRYK